MDTLLYKMLVDELAYYNGLNLKWEPNEYIKKVTTKIDYLEDLIAKADTIIKKQETNA